MESYLKKRHKENMPNASSIQACFSKSKNCEEFDKQNVNEYYNKRQVDCLFFMKKDVLNKDT